MSVSKNKIVLAVAGSGKTTNLVKEAVKIVDDVKNKILIITYTTNGINSINEKILENNLGVPHDRIKVLSWYQFLFNECILPYQKDFDKRIESKGILFAEETPMKKYKKRDFPVWFFEKKNSPRRFLTATTSKLYADTMSDFLIQISNKNSDLFIKRLEDSYTHILIDEVQDLNGEDLDIVEKLLKSKLYIQLIGDHRQATFNTHNSQRYKQYQGTAIKNLFIKWKEERIVELEELLECHRSIQDICDFSDLLYPNESAAKSKYYAKTDLDGVFLILEKDINNFYNYYNPQVLRWDKRNRCLNLPAMNFGDSKALTRNRTLIFPTNPFLQFIYCKTQLSDSSKYYIALTRARNSVCIVVKDFNNIKGFEKIQHVFNNQMIKLMKFIKQ